MNPAVIASMFSLLAFSSISGQGASAWLPAGHWSGLAAARLEALGLVSGFDASARQHRSDGMALVFRDAVAAARTRGAGGAALLDLAESYARRFAEEQRGAVARAVAAEAEGVYVSGAIASTLVLRENARLAGGYTLDREWTGPQPASDLESAGGEVYLGGAMGRHLAATITADGVAGDWRVTHLTVDAAIGPAAVWAGRRAPGYSASAGGGLVLDGAVGFEGAGLGLLRPTRVAWLGGITGELFAGRVDRNGFVERPWFFGMRVHASPHRRFDVGATRAAVFGGMNGAGTGPRQIAEVLLGLNLGGDHADDQVASIDARWRPPVRVPLELYAEWGMHDADPGVLLVMPSFAVGAWLPALPFAPAVAAGLEHTRIARSCCRNPPWYQHFELAAGWTEGGVPLGHPLGGHGHEWRFRLHASPAGARVLADVSLHARTRASENLYAPERAGESFGASVALESRITRWLSVHGSLQLEDGEDWRETRGRLGLRATY